MLFSEIKSKKEKRKGKKKMAIHLFIVNLKRRKDRWDLFEKHINDLFKQDNQKSWFSYERFEAVCNPLDPRTGCMHSHRDAVALAKERGYKRIWVCEDDVIFRFTDADKMRIAFETAEKYMVHVNAGIMLGGSSHCSGLKVVRKKGGSVATPPDISFLSVTGRFSGTHCLCYDVDMCHSVLHDEKWCPKGRHVDVSLSEYMSKNRSAFPIFVIVPFIAYARDGDSDIRGGEYCEDQKYFETAEASCKRILKKTIF